MYPEYDKTEEQEEAGLTIELEGPGIEWEVTTPNKKIKIVVKGEDLEEVAEVANALWAKSLALKG